MSIILLFLGVILIYLLIFGFLKSKQFIEHLIKMLEKVVQEYKNSGWNSTEKGANSDVNLSEGDVYINGKNMK
ncbi:hypothetical protein [Staphylococcus xylosus]|uniref:hypothetical protein n=1 Tax=Staphylococcus xylosus TaxID=1288 RepID=UPI001CDD345F|nr:hypothetical protein [Staphylococcus xylosus]UBV40019.1 hypothetical protein JGY87_12650 [Staphylococcus xylosus]